MNVKDHVRARAAKTISFLLLLAASCQAIAETHPDIDAALQGPKKNQSATELLPLFAVSSGEEFAKLSDTEAYKRLIDTVAKLPRNCSK